MGRSPTPSQSRKRERLPLPWDISEWVDRQTLAEWIVQVVETLDWSNPELVSYLSAHPEYQPKQLLCLLTYAYATAVFDSEDVARLCFSQHAASLGIRGNAPSAASIQRFRRENRGLLRWCLAEVFKRALKRKFNLGDFLCPPGIKRDLEDAASIRLDFARNVDRASGGL